MSARLSVLMSFYAGAVPHELDAALASILDQTLPPDEVVLVRDGPVGAALSQVVAGWQERLGRRLVLVENTVNLGLGRALDRGLRVCSGDLVARMDADDISLAHRLQRQARFMATHQSVDVVSAWTAAFDKQQDRTLFVRKGPCSHAAIDRLARFRSPISHGACMFRRSAVRAAGGYQHMEGLEDYHLWARMLLAGARFACIPEVLYLVRWNACRTRDRRAGIRRAVAQARLQREFLRIGFVSLPQGVTNTCIRVMAATLPAPLVHEARRLARV